MSSDRFVIQISGSAVEETSVFSKTAFSTDTETTPLGVLGGFKETAFSTDVETSARNYGLALLEDTW